MESFEYRLRELRSEKNLTQKKLAALIGTTDDSVYSWEKGRSQPSFETVQKLCTLFEVSADYLLGRSDDFGNVTVQNAAEPALSAEERKLIEDYRGLGQPLKEVLKGLIKTWQNETAQKRGAN